MLNEKTLSKILNTSLPPLTITDIHWKTQESCQNSLLFYKMTADPTAEAVFQERIREASFSWLIVNREVAILPKNCSIIREDQWPLIQKEVLDILYPLPSLKLIALTGTNGKTTTTELVLQLGDLVGKKGMSIGTLGVRELHRPILNFGLTSPSFIDLRKFLHRYGPGKDFCVLEASSHALSQERLFGLKFDGAGWLSFSQDHLDYHQSMEAYFEAKALLFKQLNPEAKLFIPGEQQALFEKVMAVFPKTHKAPALEGNLPLFFRTRFNRNNLEVAVAIIEDVFQTQVPQQFEKISPPDGRFYIKSVKSNYIVVDFAHTPDALENICQGIRESFPQHSLKVLFGCGGDRDRSKRPLMGKIAEKWADEIYVTSDNPRSEDPQLIIDDIIKGIQRKAYKAIVDRRLAVETAFQELKQNEVLLLAGKGHEDYILIKGVKYPYSDIQEVEQYLLRIQK